MNILSFEQFKNKFKRPEKKEIRQNLIFNLDKTLPYEEYMRLVENIDDSVEEVYLKEYNAYVEESTKLRKEFEKDCELHYGFEHFPEEIKRLIHYKAWEKGHYAGFIEVFYCYDDIVEFVDAILKYMNDKTK